MDVLPLLRRIDVALDEVRRTKFDPFICPDKKGARHNLGNSDRSTVNSAALRALAQSRPDYISDVFMPDVNSWSAQLLTEARALVPNLTKGRSETRHQAAYRLGQLQLALKDHDIESQLHSWAEASIREWSLRKYAAPSLFLVHLADPPAGLAQHVFALSEYVIARQVAAAASGDWPDFNAIDLALALSLVKSSALSPSLLAASIKILNGFSERELIWKNHPSATVSGSSAGCSSLFACVRLIRHADRAVVSRLEPALVSHLMWALDSTILDCWRGSDLPGRFPEPETWFNCLCVEFFEAARDHLRRGLEERLQYSYGARRCESSIPLIDVAMSPKVRQSLDYAFVAPLRNGSPREREHFSAILFGPPGTAKTTIAEAIAREVQWPLIELGVADFLSRGLEEVYSRSSEIFRDLIQLSNVVILLDEVEQVFRNRSNEGDLRQNFLTSALLPPLKRLRDEKRVILLIATNFIDAFDEAAKRIGRIDLILPIGTPDKSQRATLIEKVLGYSALRAQDLADILPEGVTIGDIKSLGKIDNHATLAPAQVLTEWTLLFPSGPSVSPEQTNKFNQDAAKYSRFK